MVIERLCGDLNLLRKKVADYESIAYAFLSLKKPASMCGHPNDVGKEKAMCVNKSNSHDPILPWLIQIEKHKRATWKIDDLEKALRIAREEEC